MVQHIRDRGHGQPLPATSVTSPGAGARYSDRTRGHCLKRIWRKILVISKAWSTTKGMRRGVRPQVADAEDDNANAKPLRRNAHHRGTTPYAPNVQAAHVLGLRTHACIGGPIVFVTVAAGLVHFTANAGETISSTSQLHMEDKSQFSESFGTPHRAG